MQDELQAQAGGEEQIREVAVATEAEVFAGHHRHRLITAVLPLRLLGRAVQHCAVLLVDAVVDDLSVADFRADGQPFGAAPSIEALIHELTHAPHGAVGALDVGACDLETVLPLAVASRDGGALEIDENGRSR